MAKEISMVQNDSLNEYPATDDEQLKKYLLPNTTIEM
jgi:hypothetical protein